MRRGTIWSARIVMVAVSVAFSWLVGEFVVAWIAPQNLSIWDNTRDGMTVHRVHADVYLPRFDQRIRTNNLGMRDEERSVTKSPGKIRVLLLGDSFLEALQVPFADSFPARLEKALEKNDPDLEVVNLAVSGWGTDDEVTYLERHGLALEPDGVLIMMTLHNDLSDNARLEFHTLESSGLVARPVDVMPFSRFAIQKLKAYLAGTSQLYQLAYQTSVRDRVRRGAAQLDHHVVSLLRRETSPDIESGWALTLALLDEAVEVTERQGAWLVIGMIPIRVQVDEAAFRDFAASHGLSEAEMDRTGPQRRIAAWARSRGILLIDLLPAFTARAVESNEELYLPFDGHWSAAGHALATESVAAELTSHVLRADR